MERRVCAVLRLGRVARSEASGGVSLLVAVSLSPLLFTQLGDADARLLAGTLGAALS